MWVKRFPLTSAILPSTQTLRLSIRELGHSYHGDPLSSAAPAPTVEGVRSTGRYCDLWRPWDSWHQRWGGLGTVFGRKVKNIQMTDHERSDEKDNEKQWEQGSHCGPDVKFHDFSMTSSAMSECFHLFPLGSLILLFNSAENVLKLQAGFHTSRKASSAKQ